MLYTLIGKKISMTQVYDEGNALIPVTIIEAGPCPVSQVKKKETDGYNSIQISYGKRKASRSRKPIEGHFKKAGVQPCQILKEVRCPDSPKHEVGEVLTVKGFQEGQFVDVIGNTRGKGFQGVVKRHGFSGGPASHGSMFHRRGGSYGQCQWPGEVDKGRAMPGRTGNERRTVQSLKVIKIFEDKNIILVKGSIPGSSGTSVIIRDAKKKRLSASRS